MEGSVKDLFKYIVKESTKSVIVISDSDDEEISVTTVFPSKPAPKRSNKRKRERNLPGNASDPIALLSDSEEEGGENKNKVACSTPVKSKTIDLNSIITVDDTLTVNDNHVAVNTNALENKKILLDIKTQTVDERTQAVDVKTQAVDVGTHTLDVETQAVDVVDVKTKVKDEDILFLMDNNKIGNNLVNDNDIFMNAMDIDCPKHSIQEMKITQVIIDKEIKLMNDTSDRIGSFDVIMEESNDVKNSAQEIKSTIDNAFGGTQMQQQQQQQQQQAHVEDYNKDNMESHTLASSEISFLSQMDEDFSDDGLDFNMSISTSEISLSPPLSPLSDAPNDFDLNMEPPVTVETFIPDNMDLATRLRSIELYLQSVTDIEIVSQNNETRVSRRTRDPANNSRNNTEHITQFDSNNPYVPNRVWYNSTWEDWAQLDVGDVLHVPFTEQEIHILKTAVEKQNIKKSRSGRELVDFWQYLSSLLPGRSPLDCRCFWTDYIEGKFQLYTKPIIITRRKNKPKNRSLHQMITKRRRTGTMNYNSVGNTLLANMKRENTISEGSGDAISLAIFKYGGGVRIAAGSLCDENEQYNMPGNLRLWDSELDHTLILKGHKTETENNQGIWRTVTDIKMSKDKSLIYSASHDGCANIWKAMTGRLVSTLQYHCKPINQMTVDYSTDENVLATCSNDGTATIWKIGTTGKTGEGYICELDLNFYSDPAVECIEFGFQKTANRLFLGINNRNIDHPGYIEVFDTNNCSPIMKFDSMKGSISAFAVSSSGRYIVSGNYNNYDDMPGDGYIHMHDCTSRNAYRKFYSGHPDVNVVAISPCERYIASGNADKEKSEVLVFDVRNEKKALHKLCHDQTLVNQSLIAPDSSMGIGGLCWLSDSRTIITGGGDSTVKVWGIEGETRLIQTYQTSSCVTSLALDEETMTIAAGVAGAEGVVHVWRP